MIKVKKRKITCSRKCSIKINRVLFQKTIVPPFCLSKCFPMCPGPLFLGNRNTYTKQNE